MTAATRTTIATAAVHAREGPGERAGAGVSGSGAAGRGAVAAGALRTATPGPDGIMTSDQVAPSHQRTMPAAPLGSGYQPGGGVCPAPVTPPA